MKSFRHTDLVIEDMLHALCVHGTARERYVQREALRNLVRLAKAEQLQQMKADVQVLVVPAADVPSH